MDTAIVYTTASGTEVVIPSIPVVEFRPRPEFSMSTLEQFTELYLSLGECMDVLTSDKIDIPKKPDVILAEEDYIEYRKQELEATERHNKRSEYLRIVGERLTYVERVMILHLPLENTRFKVKAHDEYYSVAKYFESWGNAGWNPRVEPWRDDLGPVKNPVYN